MTVWTSNERLQKLGWLNKYSEQSSLSKLKQQKFLFFYEMFSKIKNNSCDLSYLKAYRKGPVFSEVYGDSLYESSEFKYRIENANDFENIDEEVANAALMLISMRNESELSELTHIFDLWKSKKDRIDNGEEQIPILETDITQSDESLISRLYETYSELSRDEIKPIEIDDKIFVISRENLEQLTSEHKRILEKLSKNTELENPVYLEIDEGVLLVD